MKTDTYSSLRKNLARVWDEIESTQEPVIVTRKGHEDLALLPADELDGLRETAHLLRSPENARRLIESMDRAFRGEAEAITPAELRDRLKLDK